VISWLGFTISPNSKHLLECFKQKLEDQDVCYGTDVPLVVTAVQEALGIRYFGTVSIVPLSAAMPLSESH
jgi:hypothetical protein